MGLSGDACGADQVHQREARVEVGQDVAQGLGGHLAGAVEGIDHVGLQEGLAIEQRKANLGGGKGGVDVDGQAGGQAMAEAGRAVDIGRGGVFDGGEEGRQPQHHAATEGGLGCHDGLRAGVERSKVVTPFGALLPR